VLDDSKTRVLYFGSARRTQSAIATLGILLLLLSGCLGLTACGSSSQLYEQVQRLSAFGTGEVRTISWSGHSQYLAAGFINPLVHIWTFPGGQETGSLSHLGGGISQMAWSPNTPRLAVIIDQPQDQLRIWDPLNGHALATLSSAVGASAVAWSPNGSLLAVTVKGGVQLYDTVHWQCIHTLPYAKETAALAWAPDGHLLAVSGETDITTGYIDLWDVANTRRVQTIPWQDWATRLSWSPDGKYIAAPAAAHTVQIWDMSSRRITETLAHDARIRDLDWDPTGARLAVGAADEIRIWEPTTGAPLAIIPYTGDVATAVRWSPDGAYLAGAGLSGDVTVFKAK
jgi:WD40 repeat protein